MDKFKNLSFIFLVCYFLNQSNFILASTTTIDRKQARNYLGHLIDTLFIPTNHSGKYERELRNFTDDTILNLLRGLGHYPTSFSFSKVYKTEELYKGLIEESVSFIKEKIIEYTRDCISNVFVPAKINKQDIIYNVKEKLDKQVDQLISKSGDLSVGLFTNHYGAPLYDKITVLIKDEVKRMAVQEQKPTYPSIYPTEECPICYETFDKYSATGQLVKRLYLKCGHNLCVDCLRSWTKEKGQYVTCPICRSNVNISDFAHILWPPSAPY